MKHSRYFVGAASRYAFFLFLLSTWVSCASIHKNQTDTLAARSISDLKPTVILVSIDGFRHDYLSPTNTPHLASLANQGVRATRLLSVFPSLTFPNHYSIVTGLYPAKHGIVANTFKDPEIESTFVIGKPEIVDDSRWWGGEPLWVTAQKQGQKSASMFWVGSSALIQSMHPTYWRPYDKSLPREARVDQVLSWLDLPTQERPTFITLYFDEVDTAGHQFGPKSPETAAAAHSVDEALATLSRGLEARGIAAQINLMIVSDHGMTDIDPTHYISVMDYITLEDADTVGGGALMGIYPKPGKEAEVIARLRTANPHFKAYLKSEIPARYHYRQNSRIAPIVVVADLGWYLGIKPDGANTLPKGMHGFDPAQDEMGGLFVASGPAFARNKIVKPFSNIHIYSLAAHLLGLAPAKNDGNFEKIRSVLKTSAEARSQK